MKSRNAVSALILAGIITAAPVLSAQVSKPPVTKPAAVAKTPTAAPKPEESQAALMKEAKITLAAATATAMKEVPGGKIAAHELERENGKLIYSFDIKVAGKSGIEEVAVDAMTGAMIEHAHETPADEAKEKAADAKKAAPTAEESQTALMKEAKVTEAAALATALKEVPGGKVQEKELERENGKLIYSIILKVAGKAGVEEINVDAMTGAIVNKEHENDAKPAPAKAPAKAVPAKKTGGGGF